MPEMTGRLPRLSVGLSSKFFPIILNEILNATKINKFNGLREIHRIS